MSEQVPRGTPGQAPSQPTYGAPSQGPPAYGSPGGYGPQQGGYPPQYAGGPHRAPSGHPAGGGIAIAALAVGIGAFLFGWVPVLGMLIGGAAIFLGLRARAARGRQAFWITGVALGAVGALTSFVVLAVLIAGGGSSDESEVAITQDAAEKTTAAPAAEPEPQPEPEPSETSAAPVVAVMEDWTGQSLEAAMSAVDEVAAGTDAHDVSGAARTVLLRSNWQVCDQSVAPGAPFEAVHVSFGAVKFGESCAPAAVAAPEPAAPAAPPAPSASVGPLGSTLSVGDVSYTGESVTCGISTLGDGNFGVSAQGEFCEFAVTVTNNGDSATLLSSGDFTAFIGSAAYETDDSAWAYVDETPLLEDLNPGLSQRVLVYFDVPAGGYIDRVEAGAGWFSDGVTFTR